MSHRIVRLSAIEILDSRSRPTLEVTVELADGIVAVAGVPSGASTGKGEAVELRDQDPRRFGGAGVTVAAQAVNGEIADWMCSRDWRSLAEADQALIELDGTDDKRRLGANSIVGVSMALARAMAHSAGQQLHDWLRPSDVQSCLPVPHLNVINGGAHAQNRLDFQEFMIAPLAAPTFGEGLRAGAETYAVLRRLIHDRGMSTGLGDEGGFAPDLSKPHPVLDLLVEAITTAGYQTGRQGIAIALDPAANGFHTGGRYQVADEQLTSGQMIELYAELIDRYPIWSIEDGLAEDDWDGWQQLTDRLGEKIQLVGDDIFVTNPAIITEAINRHVGNAALIKVNQIGTVTETLEAMRVCRQAGYAQMVSHRSGETTDTFIADLAVATGCGQLKTGAPARGERIAKYNRLLTIEHDTSLAYGR
ncbi:MAG: phosphopyruvate hydratase [Acidimicrobiia bacterium]